VRVLILPLRLFATSFARGHLLDIQLTPVIEALPSSKSTDGSLPRIQSPAALFVAMALESWGVYFLGTAHHRHQRLRVCPGSPLLHGQGTDTTTQTCWSALQCC
jgi:hypothetical protein